MRILVRHDTTYRYEAPARLVSQRLLLTPRNCSSQHVRQWRVEVDRDCRLLEREDAFGNVLQSLSADGPVASITTSVVGEVETFDTNGIVQGSIERFAPELFLRQTALTAPDGALKALSAELAAAEEDTLGRLHALSARLSEALALDAADGALGGAGAAAAYASGVGARQDFANIFVSAARGFCAPARVVSGYFRDPEGAEAQAQPHLWAESFVERLGWVGFDATRGLSPDESYVRVAIGLDALEAAPVRAAHVGGDGEKVEVRVRVEAARSQRQS